VIPGVVLCGDRGSLNDTDHLQAICRTGIDTFVSLQARSETKAAISYADRAASLVGFDRVRFIDFPITDQSVAEDDLVMEFVHDLVARLAGGAHLYIHCKGGHGRTGTIISLLLGTVYPNLGAMRAMALAQWAHDCRVQPVFAGPSRWPGAHDAAMATCDDHVTMLFPVQVAQVHRILACPSDSNVPMAERASSDAFGKGASAYDEDLMQRWQALGVAGREAAQAGDWPKAVAAFREVVALRPDWPKSYICLSRALAKRGERREAARVLSDGLHSCCQAGQADETERALLQRMRDRLTVATFAKGAVASESGTHACAQASAPAPAVRGPTSAQLECSSADALLALSESAQAPASTPPLPPPASAHAQSDPALAPAGTAAAPGASLGAVPGAGSSAASLAASLPELIVLCGCPGVGKSTFAAALAKAHPKRVVVVSQDQLGGSRAAFEAALATAAKTAGPAGCVVADRCNVKAEDRRSVLDIAFNPRRAACFAFSVPTDECVRRVAARHDHPTIPFGRGKPAVVAMAKEFARSAPTTSEGFERVHLLRSADEVDALLLELGATGIEAPPVGLVKFPRTRHVINTGGGAVTRDDLVMDRAEAGRFYDGITMVIAEEKVDGANVGFSLTASYEVRVQNRSHYVTSETSTQFKALQAWIDEHSWMLCSVLRPERDVLYGEWCYAKHSIEYTRLPGYFIAFDLLDKVKNAFLGRAEFRGKMEEVGLPVVRELAHRPFHGEEDLLSLLDEQSVYTDGFVEGAYLRIDAVGESRLVARGKIVRPDFIQNIEDHWQTKTLVRNRLRLSA